MTLFADHLKRLASPPCDSPSPLFPSISLPCDTLRNHGLPRPLRLADDHLPYVLRTLELRSLPLLPTQFPLPTHLLNFTHAHFSLSHIPPRSSCLAFITLAIDLLSHLTLIHLRIRSVVCSTRHDSTSSIVEVVQHPCKMSEGNSCSKNNVPLEF